MKSCVGFVLLSCCLAPFVSCKLQEEETGGGTVKVADLRITDEIQNWTEASYAYCSDLAALAATAFDGEAYKYQSQGLGESIYQTFTGGTNRDIYSCVMSFPAASNAATAFEDRVAEETGAGTATVAVPGYQSSVATLLRNGADFLGYGHFDKFLVKIQIYGLQEQEAQSTAESFFGAYEAMIGS
jgi:hypothetical protein